MGDHLIGEKKEGSILSIDGNAEVAEVGECELVQLRLQCAGHQAGAAVQQAVRMERLTTAEIGLGDQHARISGRRQLA